MQRKTQYVSHLCTVSHSKVFCHPVSQWDRPLGCMVTMMGLVYIEWRRRGHALCSGSLAHMREAGQECAGRSTIAE